MSSLNGLYLPAKTYLFNVFLLLLHNLTNWYSGVKPIFDIFRIRREERMGALFMLFVLTLFNALVVYKYYELFTPIRNTYWPLFIRNFHVSGFDPITYAVVSDWSAGYNVYRHPLLAFYMYVPYLLNQALMWLTGINCAVFIVAAIQIFCALYAFVFFFRIMREIVGLACREALLLSFFFFSFAYVMLSAMVPDHFIISMMLLLITLYISGRSMKSRQVFKIWQSFLYFMLVAGISLNNGIKVFLSVLFVNRRRFFRPKYLFLAVILPAALLWSFSKWEYATLVWPTEVARHAAKAKKRAEDKEKEVAMQQRKTVRLRSADTTIGCPEPAGKQIQKINRLEKSVPIGNDGFMSWTDISTSRMASAVENLFGESIQLHRDYLLEDGLHSRPMIVKYRWVLSYVVEAVVLLLFVMGVWCGRRSRFLWLVLSYFGLDMLLHMGLGFGLNEVYIMAAHWIYAIPIAVAYLLVAANGAYRRMLLGLLTVLTAYLWIYNGTLISAYLMGYNC